jgi:small-conductance mechanosensitive channel
MPGSRAHGGAVALLDRDGDQKITFKEFAHRKMHAFSSADGNKDGYLEQREVMLETEQVASADRTVTGKSDGLNSSILATVSSTSMTPTATERSISRNSPETPPGTDPRSRSRLNGAGGLVRAASMRLLLAALIVAAGWVAAANAQEAGQPPPPQTSSEVRLFLDLLDDPEVRAWIEEQRQGAPPAAQGKASSDPMMSPHMVSSRIDRVRQNLASLSAAVPRVPEELGRVRALLMLELQDTGLIRIGILFALFVLLGLGLELLYRRATRGLLDWIAALPIETPAGRVRSLSLRLGYGVGQVCAFALGSIGGFLPFRWPPLLRDIILAYLIAALVLRLSLAISDVVFAPRQADARRRLAPLDEAAARFWHIRINLLIGWFAFGYATVALLAMLGLLPEVRRLVAYTLGLGLVAIGLEMLWRRPVAAQDARPRRRLAVLAGSVFIVLLWILWVAGAMPAFWLLAILAAAPLAIRGTRRAIEHVVGAEGGQRWAKSLLAVLVERGLRAAILIGAALFLARMWEVDLTALTASDTVITRLARGAFSAVVIVMVTDLLWQIAKTMIDRKIMGAQAPGSQLDTEETRRRSRLRTLLPILRNLLAIVFLVMAVMMVLSAIGIEIGPLIAGAGVVGVAIGFGAQTLVKDIISGMFYLLDDAFRVGEYIQSGNYKGTVESFSLRSVKLRHHRGPLYTVPFGELGAVQNMSRDWVIDKLTIGVTYDTDLEKAKKLIKQVGKDLAIDPEFAPNLIETLKMQGVEQFGEFAIQLRMKMMTRPGEQFVIRRRAYSMIKKAFDDNGIKFAVPTVHVAEGGETAAAAQQALKSLKAPAET